MKGIVIHRLPECKHSSGGEMGRRTFWPIDEVRELSCRKGPTRVRADENQRKGEFVLVVRGCEDDAAAVLIEGQRLYAKLKEHLSPSQAAKLAAELSGAPRKALYAVE